MLRIAVLVTIAVSVLWWAIEQIDSASFALFRQWFVGSLVLVFDSVSVFLLSAFRGFTLYVERRAGTFLTRILLKPVWRVLTFVSIHVICLYKGYDWEREKRNQFAEVKEGMRSKATSLFYHENKVIRNLRALVALFFVIGALVGFVHLNNWLHEVYKDDPNGFLKQLGISLVFTLVAQFIIEKLPFIEIGRAHV